ncbi:MAG: 2Fe-2S iron-sulfur cluster-binding protein, partial [Pseudomonadota bacterium]|nr:2Fe-2S iron-sulfur cluster-binding protein [Pseudomonadota bacterium]
MTIEFILDGNVVETSGDETILQVAKKHQIEIPHLCFKEEYRPDGNCRSCVVEIEGERTLAPSCCRYPKDGMIVKTSSKKAKLNQQIILELLEADLGEKVSSNKRAGSELEFWMKKFNISENRFPKRDKRSDEIDTTNPAINVNLNQGIKCTRCIRACREEQGNDVIGLAKRGAESKIIFDIQDLLGDSSCVTCGECVQACPTDALVSKARFTQQKNTKSVKSVCPYCGVGCLLN